MEKTLVRIAEAMEKMVAQQEIAIKVIRISVKLGETMINQMPEDMIDQNELAMLKGLFTELKDI